MGIALDGISIILGCLLGNKFKDRISFSNFFPLGVAIMLMSIMGFLENVLKVINNEINANTVVIIFSLILGNYAGDFLKIDDKLSNLSKCKKNECNALIDAVLFFGVGGLQISGPILMAVNNDSSQLILKSIIDFPFAMMFGISYGKITSLSAFPIIIMQIVIAVLAHFTRNFLSTNVMAQLCAIGYIILFFTGFNFVCESKYRINNTNMLPSVAAVIIINLFMSIWRAIV